MTQLIIRATCFEAWFKANLKEYQEDIANHGADRGFPKITYTADTCKIFNRFCSQIWDMAVEDAEEMGYKNVAAVKLGSLQAALDSIDSFKNRWFGMLRKIS